MVDKYTHSFPSWTSATVGLYDKNEHKSDNWWWCKHMYRITKARREIYVAVLQCHGMQMVHITIKIIKVIVHENVSVFMLSLLFQLHCHSIHSTQISMYCNKLRWIEENKKNIFYFCYIDLVLAYYVNLRTYLLSNKMPQTFTFKMLAARPCDHFDFLRTNW